MEYFGFIDVLPTVWSECQTQNLLVTDYWLFLGNNNLWFAVWYEKKDLISSLGYLLGYNSTKRWFTGK